MWFPIFTTAEAPFSRAVSSILMALPVVTAACLSSTHPSRPLRLANATPVRQIYVADVIFSEALLLNFDYNPSVYVHNPQAQERLKRFHAATLRAVGRELTARGYEVLGLSSEHFNKVSHCHALEDDPAELRRWAREERPSDVPNDAAIVTILFCVQDKSSYERIFGTGVVVDEWPTGGKPKELWSSHSDEACQWDTDELSAQEEQENDMLYGCIKDLLPALFAELPRLR